MAKVATVTLVVQVVLMVQFGLPKAALANAMAPDFLEGIVIDVGSGLRRHNVIDGCGGIPVVEVATTTTASGSRDDINGSGRQKRTGDGHLVLSCSIMDGDTGLEPASYAPLIQGDEIASGYNI